MKKQSGRSMIEMLGVLAIIAVLTIGGVWGYRVAMDKYWANKVIHDVQVYHMTLDERGLRFGEDGYAPTTDFVAETQYEYAGFEPDRDSGYWEIDVKTVSKGICKAVLEKSERTGGVYRIGSDYVMGVGRGQDSFALYRGNTSICQDENTMLFFVGDVTHLCEENCETSKPCYYGTCCAEENQCNGDCCGTGQVCCNGACHTADCGTDSNGLALEMNENCQCQCPTGQGFAAEMVNGACVCNTDNGFGVSGNSCACTDSNKVNVNGKCMAFGCYTKEDKKTTCPSENCHCFIGDERCGYSCGATDKSTCTYGLCYDACLGNKWEYNQGTKNYGCITPDNRFHCNKYSNDVSCVEKGKNYQYFCGKKCSYDGTGCAYGDCTDVCSDKTYNQKAGVFERMNGRWGCRYGDVSCVKISGKYYCYKNGDVCAQGCTNPYPDSTCSNNDCARTTCPTGTEENKEGLCVRSDGVYCKMLGTRDLGYGCYLPNGELCGQGCDDNGTNCKYGCCDGNLTDGQYQCCPSGDNISYQRISSYYGCYNSETKIGCYNENKDKTSYICELNGVRCANGCNSTGTSCKYGSCDASSCPTGTTFQEIVTNYFGCYNNSLDLGCRKRGSVTRYCCYKDGTECNDQCGPNYDGYQADGKTACGTCREGVFTCPNEDQIVVNESTKGCLNPNGIVCLTDGKCYTNYGNTSSGPNQYRCGTGCKLDGTGCSEGVCDPNYCTQANASWSYNATKDLYECQEGGAVVCSNGVCSINGHQCGTGCNPQQYKCTNGVCWANACPEEVKSIRQATSDFFGCYNASKNTVCYPYGSDVKCVRNELIVGTDCHLDGSNCTCTSGTGKAIGDVGVSVSADDVCAMCPKGTCASGDGTSCLGSNPSAFTKTQICLNCPKGTYRGESRATTCADTSAGNYTVGTGNRVQSQCPTGKTTAGTGYYDDATECATACAGSVDVDQCKKETKSCGCQPTSNTCLKNADCAPDTEFCKFPNITNYASTGLGECVPLTEYPEDTLVSDGKTWIRSKETMNWWSGQNWCQAKGFKPVTRSDIGCANVEAGSYCITLLEGIKNKWNTGAYLWLESYGITSAAYLVQPSNQYMGGDGFWWCWNAARAFCQN